MSLIVPRRRRTDINVVPLIDVMVVLVFFLLLSGRFDQARTMGIIPPAAAAGSESPAAPALVVGVDRDGKFYLEGKEIAATALAPALVDHALKAPGGEVVIVADERSLTGAAVRALDAVAKAGLKPRLQTRQPR
jgi:biopolymer transport protein ExbD